MDNSLLFCCSIIFLDNVVVCEVSLTFALVRNVKAKYGIVDDDIYNFEETGFMIGIVFAGMVVTTSDGLSKAKLA